MFYFSFVSVPHAIDPFDLDQTFPRKFHIQENYRCSQKELQYPPSRNGVALQAFYTPMLPVMPAALMTVIKTFLRHQWKRCVFFFSAFISLVDLLLQWS
ncbi:hypothetical protein CEXT_445011 [Caerostris extrusa]|uniref:Uncharacterized protein n=1 Tax=Caerostris extrusa TaxID=172846 RepID=A0AAV4UNA8_CAEEX|nr:hypothetical protein CEXT_445011 [Caerostris extrusa]